MMNVMTAHLVMNSSQETFGNLGTLVRPCFKKYEKCMTRTKMRPKFGHTSLKAREVFTSLWLLICICVHCFRLGRHGKVFLTIPSQSSTDEQKFIQKGETPGTDSLFDFDPKDLVFFVGGVPPDVKVMNFIKTLNTNKYLFNHVCFS